MTTSRTRAGASRSTPVTTTAAPTPPHTPVSPASRWQWRTFPVFCAFIAGLLIASLLNRQTDTGTEAMIQYAALLGAAYIVVHLFVTNVIVAGRVKRREATLARGETPPEDFEDNIVYPDDEQPAT